jgi:hypothetical protein
VSPSAVLISNFTLIGIYAISDIPHVSRNIMPSI